MTENTPETVTCENCYHDFEPPDEHTGLCFDCRVKEMREMRRR